MDAPNSPDDLRHYELARRGLARLLKVAPGDNSAMARLRERAAMDDKAVGRAIADIADLEVAQLKQRQAEPTANQIAAVIIAEETLRRNRARELLRGLTNSADADEPARPVWNTARGVLTYDGVIVRQVKRQARNIRLVLDQFQAQGWPDRIDSPFSKNPQAHHSVIASFNLHSHRLKLRSDGNGTGFEWHLGTTGRTTKTT